MKAIARRARRRSACTVGRALRAPFPALVRHFLRRMARRQGQIVQRGNHQSAFGGKA